MIFSWQELIKGDGNTHVYLPLWKPKGIVMRSKDYLAAAATAIQQLDMFFIIHLVMPKRLPAYYHLTSPVYLKNE